MIIIHKSIIRTDRQAVFIPVSAKVLTAQIQAGNICIWYLFDDTKLHVNRFFSVFGTGMEIEEKKFDYVATVQQDGFVWHVFEVYP
jgi:pyrroline-5-carboxylate reductase